MEIIITTPLIIAIIIGLVEVFKKVGLNKKFAPILSVILGLVASFLVIYFVDTPVLNAIIGGIIIGLSATGLYSGVKNTTEGLKGKIT